MAETEVRLTKLADCAGCGAKVGAGTLAELLGDLKTITDEDLLVGFDKSDDASVYRVSDDLALVQTVDFFPPVVDDAYTFGQIAATNALSDVYAMGGEPKLALNIMAVPADLPRETVHDILRGGYEKAYEAGCIITGGHSILDKEPKYGLAVTGFVRPEKILTNSGAAPSDRLILTKPLGIGILTTAKKGELTTPEEDAAAIRQMTTLNKAARDLMVQYDVHACTDVTGFGLLGHALEMAEGSGVRIVINPERVPFLPGVRNYAEMGILAEGMYRNREFAEAQVATNDIPLAVQDVLYDPQTAGGLLIAVAEKDAASLLHALQKEIPEAAEIGFVTEYTAGTRIHLET